MMIFEKVISRIRKTDDLRSKIGKLHQLVAIIATTIITSLSLTSIWIDQPKRLLPLLGILFLSWFIFEFLIVVFMLGEHVESRLDQVSYYAEELRDYCVSKFDLLEKPINTGPQIAQSTETPKSPRKRVSDSDGKSSSAESRDRDSMYKLIIGMAIGGYRYNPTLPRSDIPKSISEDLNSYDLKMTDETVLKWLKISSESVLSQKIIEDLKRKN